MNNNVLIIFTSLFSGGAQIQQLRILNHLKNINYSFYICCIKKKGQYASKYENAGFPVFSLNVNNLLSIYRIVGLYKIIKKNNINIIYTKGGGDSLFWGRLIGYIAGIRKIISSLHTTGKTVDGKDPFNILNRLLASITNKYIFVSKLQREYYLKKYRIPESKSVVIHNGISLTHVPNSVKTNLKSKLKIADDLFIVGIVAVLRDYKNHFMFLNAASEVIERNKKILFLIVGDGPLRNKLEIYSKKKLLSDYVRFLGHQENNLEYISIMDTVVMTSSTTETFPNCLLEAMSQSKPIISTNVGGVPELIWEGKNGYIIDKNDSSNLGNKILKIAGDPILKENMGYNSYQFCSQFFNIKDKSLELKSIIDNL